jgi:hypothetical protein
LNIHLSLATIKSYENRSKLMNLRFNPIVFFENTWPFPISHLKDICWEIHSEQIGLQSFDVELSVDSPFEVKDNCNYIEFHLTKKNVSFQYDDYKCQIVFRAVLDSPHTLPIKIESTFFGVVKTVWSKGLN